MAINPPSTERSILMPGGWCAYAIRFKDLIGIWLARRPFITLFMAGAVSTLSMAPFHFWPVLFFTLPVLFWALDEPNSGPSSTISNELEARETPSAKTAWASWRNSPWWHTAWRGWAFGFGYHLAGLYWIGFSFLVQAERFAALMPFAILGLTASLGLFFALAGALYGGFRSALPAGMARIVLLALVVMTVEWLRGHILTGFPWNIIGYALTMPLPLMQWAGLFGIYVLTGITIVTLATPLVVLAARGPGHGRMILLATIAPLSFAALYGVYQLQANPTVFAPDVRLRLVQPAFSQRDKFDQAKHGPIFWRHVELSGQAFKPIRQVANEAGAGLPQLPTHVIWPEAAIPFFVRRSPDALRAIGEALPDNVQLIAGTFRINVPPEVPNDRVGDYRVYNSALVFGGDGRVRSVYDKIHLVPFGEYLPAQKWLNAIGLENLTRTKGGLALGRSPRRLMQVAGLPPVAMLICYEASFPDEIIQDGSRPGVLINLTNDAWFGNTTGPYQHLHQTRLRAVEQGVPMVRSANTGISAVFDPMGRTVATLGLNIAGVVDSRLPRAAATTVYAEYGWLLEFVVWLAMLIGLAIGAHVYKGSANMR